MTLSITDDRITSGVTPHTAYRHPSPVPSEHGWIVSWLPNRVLGYNLAISAMMIAELATVHAVDGTTTADDERRLQINDLAHELGMSGDDAICLVLAPIVNTEATSPGVRPEHWYEVAPFGEPITYSGTDRAGAIGQIVSILARSEEPDIWASRLPEGWNRRDGVGIAAPAEARAVLGAARVRLAEERQAALEAELEQAAEAKRDAKRVRLAALADSDCERCEGSGLDPDTFTTTKRADGQTVHHLTEPCRDCIDEDDLGDEKLVPCPYCGALVEPEVAAAMVRLREVADQDEPTKTHDLSVRRSNGNVVIEVGNETDDYPVYLSAGVAQDLGRVLAPLTPAQRQVLVDDLTGGKK